MKGFGPGLLSNQGEKRINFYFIRVPLRKKAIKYGTPKPRVGPDIMPVAGLLWRIGWDLRLSGFLGLGV